MMFLWQDTSLLERQVASSYPPFYHPCLHLPTYLLASKVFLTIFREKRRKEGGESFVLFRYWDPLIFPPCSSTKNQRKGIKCLSAANRFCHESSISAASICYTVIYIFSSMMSK